ncbi:MAG: YdcF family protein [Anaerolineales bacterium]|nr:YdcF family protein [Anaerolineales bacterium]
MFLFLSKLLPPLVYPVGLACVLIALALFLAPRRAPRAGLQRAVLALALTCLLLGGNGWVATGLARSLEWRCLPPEPLPQAEAIVLLGGSTLPALAPRPMVEISGAGDRVLYAAWLYKQGLAARILLSGGVLDWSEQDTSPAEDMATLLEMMGVPPEALWLESESRNTYENALYSARILREKGVRRILLVTSASHMPRSLKLFQAQGLQVIPMPTDFTVTQRASQEMDARAVILGLAPSAENLALSTRMLKEYIGIFVYDLRGWNENTASE